jgi:hypothetical protein
MKKVLSIAVMIMVVVMSLSAAVSAVAEADIIAALEDANVPAAYIETARSYLDENEVTDAEAAEIVGYIEEATALTDGETKFSELTGSEKSAILAKVKDAAQVLELSVTYDDNTVNIKDASGATVFTESAAGAVKQTGFDYMIVVYGLALLVVAGAAAVLVNRKLASDRA